MAAKPLYQLTAVVIVIAVILLSNKTVRTEIMNLIEPRGFRNNNPLNIREPKGGGDQWVGERATDDDKSFEEFTEMKYGIRAGVKILNRYRNKYGLVTVKEIIERWAPDHENPTNAYAEYVAKRVGVHPVAQILTDEQIPALVSAMIRFECGKDADMKDIIDGCRLAGVNV